MRLKVPMLVAGAALAALLLATAVVDEGEVVVLTSTDAQGHVIETRLWVAEVEGDLYVRAHGPEASWLQSLRERPQVQLTRKGQQRSVRAVIEPDPGVRDAVNRAMADKYGRVDRWLRWLHASPAAVAVRLEPAAAQR